MNATSLYRIAAVVLVLFAAGHTAGSLRFKPATAEGLAVREGMRTVFFQVGGGKYSYGGFYTGFALCITAYLLFTAFLAWHLGEVAATAPQTIGALAWGFVALQVVNLLLSWLYFAPVTAAFSGVVVLCLAWAAWQVR